MLTLVTGNLLEAHTDALVNTVNTVGVMGKGVALQFKQAYPDNFKAYERACRDGEVQLGRMFVVPTNRLEGPSYIVNFPTKGHWRAKSKLADIESGLDDLVRVIRAVGIRSIAVPPLGCGNGGLNWSDVRPLIERKLGGLEGVDVRMYEPQGAPAEVRVATKRPKMTAGRAALVGLLDRYAPEFGATPLELQKLMYFLQEAGEPLKLGYAKARYGPYADNLNHVLQAVEGHFLKGYGDRSRLVADEPAIEISDPAAVDEARRFLEGHVETLERFERVARLVEGFESPYGLELLSTIHWVATRIDERVLADPSRAVGHVQDWSARKGKLFTEKHIHIAWERLRDERWLIESGLADSR